VRSGILSQWEHAADDERNIRWTRDFYAAMEPYLERAVYVNDLGGDVADRVRAAYGANYDRLAAVKATYDRPISSAEIRTSPRQPDRFGVLI
jgi:hypothetical protein